MRKAFQVIEGDRLQSGLHIVKMAVAIEIGFQRSQQIGLMLAGNERRPIAMADAILPVALGATFKQTPNLGHIRQLIDLRAAASSLKSGTYLRIELSTFSFLWYLEDRDGGGLYDPSSVHPFDDKK